ncbi:MAG TPA: hypothetical protein VIM55_18910, partial [Mucilaginibacter sp.]
MKKYLLLLLPVFALMIGGCSKEAQKTPPVVPVVPEISVQNISYPTFTNSTWTNIAGGKIALEFDLLDAGGAVTSTTTDSTDYSNLVAYSKELKKGNYNIQVSSKNQTAVADTFIRFNAQI